MNKLLIANRGEIAIRIAHAATELGISTLAVYAKEDESSLHRQMCDDSVLIKGHGASAYLDIDQIIAVAREQQCEAIHPGYGFLSESAAFAAATLAANLIFVGPTPETLILLGDKVAARNLASECGVPILLGSDGAVNLSEAQTFFLALPTGASLLIKAVSGGGGRGMRLVEKLDNLETAYTLCCSEAEHAFGNKEVYVEEYFPAARHIEVQILGDGSGAISHFWERECSLQRRHQKVVEIAPSPSLPTKLRDEIIQAAVKITESINYCGLGTVEFLVDENTNRYTFIEANARLQVEHTITEEITRVDLVRAQIEIACGNSLEELNLQQDQIPAPRGFAIQTRINMETLLSDGSTKPAGGTISAFELPSGKGIRCDTYGYVGYTTSPVFDSLLAKLIIHSPSNNFAIVAAKAYSALRTTKIEGVATNLPVLRNLLALPEVIANRVNTQFFEAHTDSLLAQINHQNPAVESIEALAGSQVDTNDPLAVLAHGKQPANTSASPRSPSAFALPPGQSAIQAPMQGTIVSILLKPDETVHVGKPVIVLEAMKMEHIITAEISGIVQELCVKVGDTIFEDHPLIILEDADIDTPADSGEKEVDLDYVRPDLQEVLERKGAGLDENRPTAVAKRRKTNHRTARENIADLCDEGTFIEYGSVVVAAQRRRRSMDDLIANTTGDGMVCGLGQVNGDLFSSDRSRTLLMTYDYMVLAGTQGMKNHSKKDRLFEIAKQQRLPTILIAEGGGGRPGDTDGSGVAGLDCLAFTYFARLSALVPIVGITTGRCFAGNAVLLACCDVIIATEDSNIGIGGPAMIEGGGLGIFTPDEVGPSHVQATNGVIDILVKDEAEAVATAKKYLSYFQGALKSWEAPDKRKLRFIVPENRLRYYDMREVINGIADIASVLEIRSTWGPGIITSFIRVEGKPLGVIANNPGHLSGAIDADGADKGARFMQLCDAFDIPILSLCDCPGIMVGPEIEKTALVRHAGRMFVVGANIDVPLMTIITRKGYGLGAQAMAGGSFHAPLFTITWPTGEFGGMGLEGAVKLGYRKELEAIDDPEERKATYEKMVAGMYEKGKAVNMASHFEVDEVIDPANSRKWIIAGLRSVPPVIARTTKKRPNVDTW